MGSRHNKLGRNQSPSAKLEETALKRADLMWNGNMVRKKGKMCILTKAERGADGKQLVK